MSRRQVIKKYQLLSSEDTTTNPESVSTEIAQVDVISYQIEIDATVDATLEVKYCNDENLNSSSVFKALDFGTVLTLNGDADTDGLVHIENKGFKHIKLAVTNNGGVGNISAWITGATLGA